MEKKPVNIDLKNINYIDFDYAEMEVKVIASINKEFEAIGLHSKIVYQIHDELVFELVSGEEKQVKEILTLHGFNVNLFGGDITILYKEDKKCAM